MAPRLLPRMEAFGAIAAALYGSVALNTQMALADNFDALDYVDPLIGTANGGTIRLITLVLMNMETNSKTRTCLSRCNFTIW